MHKYINTSTLIRSKTHNIRALAHCTNFASNLSKPTCRPSLPLFQSEAQRSCTRPPTTFFPRPSQPKNASQKPISHHSLFQSPSPSPPSPPENPSINPTDRNLPSRLAYAAVPASRGKVRGGARSSAGEKALYCTPSSWPTFTRARAREGRLAHCGRLIMPRYAVGARALS